MRTCPKCGLLSPGSAVMCDCGHPFDAAGAESARAGGFSPRDETHPPGPSGAAKFGVGLLGFFAGGFPVAFLAEWRAATGQGESGLLRGLAFLMSVAGVLVALHLQKKRYAARRR